MRTWLNTASPNPPFVSILVVILSGGDGGENFGETFRETFPRRLSAKIPQQLPNNAARE